jgi:hypothetical protein
MKFAPTGPFMTELYPTDIRGTGQGFYYNAGWAIGSILEERCRLLTGWDDLGKALAHESDLLGGHLNGGALHGRSSYRCCPGEVGAAKRLI